MGQLPKSTSSIIPVFHPLSALPYYRQYPHVELPSATICYSTIPLVTMYSLTWTYTTTLTWQIPHITTYLLFVSNEHLLIIDDAPRGNTKSHDLLFDHTLGYHVFLDGLAYKLHHARVGTARYDPSAC